ncbi:carboxymuconolactone decarboxylase family protein [Yinghuangia seranimata]|uniref:carboxymuconolactone decarboxylase family protein n=1 Tax=Yinghuangia seranimata TaxID=408067 RepID=UPI00248BF3D3|nr:carboxymuconolactone decarboxylase family protein [Yinghuangia seranimata]MDI2124840.1 carboxymuconolactone decarboxylase family protein [Yinghuangia seranimata]
MSPRLDFFAIPTAGKTLKYGMAIGKSIMESPLPATTRELVSLRVSQINGCAACIDMHVKEGEAAGETAVRLHMVAAWREAPMFTDAERAALELAEEATRVADGAGGVSDEVWDNAAKHYDEEQLAALVLLVCFMNMANRLNVVTHQPVGGYEPGRFH